VLKHAPNKANAVKFLEYLASDEARRYFADGNNEWPVVAGRQDRQPRPRQALGNFKADKLPVGKLAPIAPRPSWSSTAPATADPAALASQNPAIWRDFFRPEAGLQTHQLRRRAQSGATAGSHRQQADRDDGQRGVEASARRSSAASV
jgi:hypothetical protein